MNVEIYGLSNLFASAGGWFSSGYAVILALIIVAAAVYAFFKINFSTKTYVMNAGHHYGLNGGLFIALLILAFWAGGFMTQIGLVYSVIFTILFYGVSIFALTLILIFLRRYKIKKYLVVSAKWINAHPGCKWTDNSNNPVYIIRSACVDADHAYSDWFMKELEAQKGKEKIHMNVKTYESINIWKDENYALQNN